MKRLPKKRAKKAKMGRRNPVVRVGPWEALGKRRNPDPTPDLYIQNLPEVEEILARQNPLPEKWGPELYNPLQSKDFVQKELPEVLRNPRGHLYDGSLYTSIFSRNPVPHRGPLNDPGGIYTPIYNRNPRKPRKDEVTCDCLAYNFPHRRGGGRCPDDEARARYEEERAGWEIGCGRCDGSCYTCRQMRIDRRRETSGDYRRNPDFFQNDDNWDQADFRWLDSLVDE